MKITVLGSGTAFPRKDAGSAGYLLDVDGKKMLFDLGLGTLHKLDRLGIDAREIHQVFLSHLHNDHTCELPPLLWYLFVVRKQRPEESLTRDMGLMIYGPEGTKEYVDMIWYDVLGREEPAPFIEGVVELGSGTFKIGDIDFKTEPVVHMGSTIAFRVEHEGKSLVYSGDLELCEGIQKLAKDADVLLLECAFPKGQEEEKHMNTTQCGKLAEEAGIKKLVLTHMYPQTLAVDAKAEAAEQFSGEIIVAKDMLEISI